MKKALSAIIALLIAFLLLSCNGQIQNKGEDNGPSQESEYIEPPKWEEDPTENTAGSWTISSSRLDTETVMLASMDTLFSSSSDNSGKTESNTDENGVIKKVVKEDFTTTNGVTILKDSSITFTPKSQATPDSKAAKDTAEYEIFAKIKAKITSTSDSSGSTTQKKELNVSYKATTSDTTNLTDIKTEEITTTVDNKEVYKSTSTPTALLVKSYDQQIDDMILDYVKGNQISGFDVDEKRSFYSMGKGWIYFISYADKEYHKVNFSISSDGKIENRTLDGWCESTENGEVTVSEHPAVKDEEANMPLEDQDIIDLTAQLYAYFIRYIPMKYNLYSNNPSLPQGITPVENGNLKFSNFKESEFFDTEITINGKITNSNHVISADLTDFPIKNGMYSIRIGGVSDENNSYVGGQATHAYITSDGKEYSYNYLVDEIYKVCIRVFATSRMAGLPIIKHFEGISEHNGGGVTNLHDTYYTGENQGLHYTGTIDYNFIAKIFSTSLHIDDTSSSLAQDIDFEGKGTICDDYRMINWTEANLDYFGQCSEFELELINKLMEVEFPS